MTAIGRAANLVSLREPLPPAQQQGYAVDNRLESDRFRMEFDPATGYISRLFDNTAGVEAFAGLAAVPVVIEDCNDTWSHNVWFFRDVVDRFTASGISPIAAGPVKATMWVVSECGRSRIVQDFTLSPCSTTST